MLAMSFTALVTLWQRWFSKPVHDVVLREEVIFGPCGGACLLRVDAFQRVGAFDETYFLYAEDTDLALRLQLAGYTCWFVPDAEVMHQRSATLGFQSDLSVGLTHRNIFWMMLKNFPLWFFTVRPDSAFVRGMPINYSDGQGASRLGFSGERNGRLYNSCLVFGGIEHRLSGSCPLCSF